MYLNAAKLEAWVQEKLEQYDSDPDFAAKRNKKHGDRAGYESHLKSQAQEKLQAHAAKSSGGDDGGMQERVQAEFMEQQEKITNAALQLQNVSDELQKLQMTKRMNVLSTQEVNKTDADTPVYKQYGKMFVRHEQEELASTLTAQGEKLKEKEDNLKGKFEYFEKERSSAEVNLKEMMGALQAQMAQMQEEAAAKPNK
eukprot:TRINITY_DN640_c0_g1_i3.p1 TRINITY_DN640_c0_g1~~TRINITY_DN640_c0_g1_i3.p1  ORF type:complete len:198 (+),score=81.04 TRINITY_DN640_c0_g1_i3:144-737(+)